MSWIRLSNPYLLATSVSAQPFYQFRNLTVGTAASPGRYVQSIKTLLPNFYLPTLSCSTTKTTKRQILLKDIGLKKVFPAAFISKDKWDTKGWKAYHDKDKVWYF